MQENQFDDLIWPWSKDPFSELENLNFDPQFGHHGEKLKKLSADN